MLHHQWQLQPLFGKCIHGFVEFYAQCHHRPYHHVHTTLSYPSLLLLASVRSLGQHYCGGTFDGGPSGGFLFMEDVKEGIFCFWLLIFLVTLFVSPETAIYVGLALCGALVLFNATRAKVAFTSESLLVVQLPGAEALSTYSSTSTTEVTKTVPNSLSGHGTFMIRVEGTLSYSCSTSFQVDIL